MFFFFSLLDHGSSHTTCTNRDDDQWSFCARSRQRPEVEFSFWFSTYHHQSALLRLGIAIAVRQVKPALLWKKRKEILKKYWCSPAREALAPRDPNLSRGWHQRSPTIGTCPTVKRWDGYAAECRSLFSAPQSFACVEAAGRNRVRRSSLRLLPPMLGLTSWAKWFKLVVYLCPPHPPPHPPPPPLFSNDVLLLSLSMSSLLVL